MVPIEVRAPVSMGGKRRNRVARACGSVQQAGVVAGCTGGGGYRARGRRAPSAPKSKLEPLGKLKVKLPLTIWFGHGHVPAPERHTELRAGAVVAARPMPSPAAHATASEPGIWSKAAQRRSNEG